MNPPAFPDEILQPFVLIPSKPAAPSRVSEEKLESEATPSPPPIKKAKAANSSNKGKEKMTVE